jgi:hypothetical protein
VYIRYFLKYYIFLHIKICPIIFHSSWIGTIWMSKKFFIASFSKSWILWLKNCILNWSFPFFRMNSRLWIKCQIINTHHDCSILYISPKRWLMSSMCSSTKKLVARSNDSSSKGSVSSKSQTTFSVCLPGCLFKSCSAISQATYLSNCSDLRYLYNLPSPAQRSMICRFFLSLGKNFTKIPLSKLSRCLWYEPYCSAIVLYPMCGLWIRICFWL